MLLLRTRADIVAKRIAGVIDAYPTPQVMAAAQTSEVDRVLQPLGLRWRARLLHKTSQVLVAEYGGIIPTDFERLIHLPGVGPYVAGVTVAAITGGRTLLTDTNTVRVAARVAGLRLTGDVRRTRRVQAAIATLLGGTAHLTDWLAVVDLAASICVPRNPHCQRCPIQRYCAYALDSGESATLRSRD